MFSHHFTEALYGSSSQHLAQTAIPLEPPAVMANRTASNQYLGEKPQSRRSGKSPSRSPARSPARAPAANGQKQQQKAQAVLGYQSEGVQDHDIFNLPGSDWTLLGLLTVVAAVVRLFRIAQPSSVVFDEVQYVLQIGM